MTDELRERLAGIDPMHSGVPTEDVTTTSSRELLERIMSTPTIDKSEQNESPRPTRRAWNWAFAAAAVTVVAIGAAIVFNGNGNTPVAAGPPLELSAPADNPMASCIMFSVDELAKAPLAFEGTVTEVDGPVVTLTVDHWYKGGDAETVVLNAPQGMEALIGGIPFEVGGQFLISAYEGTVNYCGFSGPSTPELRSAFDQAFGS